MSVLSVSVIISEVESALGARESVIKELVVCKEMKSRFAPYKLEDFVDDDDMFKILKKGKQIADRRPPSNDHCPMQVDEEYTYDESPPELSPSFEQRFLA